MTLISQFLKMNLWHIFQNGQREPWFSHNPDLSQKGHEEDQAKLTANPTALSAKRVWVVTWPDVEKALV